MALVRWDPFDELNTLHRNIDRLFTGREIEGRGDGEGLERAVRMAVDIQENEDQIRIHADLPGVDKDDISVQVEGNILTIRAERAFEDEENREDYHRVERYYGTYARSFTLPETADTDKMNAKHENGVLRVTIPKRPESKPRKVKVQ